MGTLCLRFIRAAFAVDPGPFCHTVGLDSLSGRPEAGLMKGREGRDRIKGCVGFEEVRSDQRASPELEDL